MNPHAILTRREACLAQHTGLWSVVPEWLDSMVGAVNRGLLQGAGPLARLAAENRVVLDALTQDDRSTWNAATTSLTIGSPHPSSRAEVQERERAAKRSFLLDESGIAVIEMVGPMMKGSSKLGDSANTVAVRRAIREAVADPEVEGILLVVDSPGGTVAGTAELAADVRAAAERKPLRAHADDLMASAAVWATAAAHRITASATTEIGSVGTVLVVQDTSEKYATEGVKVHVISTGPNKGAGAPGSELTPEHLEALTERVRNLNEHFLAALSEGRKLRGARLDAVTDGRVWIAEQARGLGLIDAVSSMDEALLHFRRSLAQAAGKRRSASAAARARMALVDAELRAEGRR